jgi:3'-phosphoadenosine 5'-phosphosulfate sulfotransferase (PAPS reductase)/FAD synthetase
VSRIVCLFSCGAASAVATKIAISEANGREILVFRNYVKEEHEDNERFVGDCEKWFGLPVHTVSNDKYGGSIFEVFRQERFVKGPGGACCTKRLKREVRERELLGDDLLVFGYTADEQERVNRLTDANNGLKVWTPLIEKGLTKDDCIGMLWRNGIKIPAMYELGYRNNNCIGCVKGGKGYWNKIRKDFPERFEEMAKVQEWLGEGSYFWPGEDGKRMSLRELPLEAGRYEDEPEVQCGIMCELVNIEIRVSK